MALKMLVFVVLAFLGHCANPMEIRSGAYEDLVISITDDVPADNCREILANLETSLSSASSYLFSALHGRAFIKSSTVILPSSWPKSCSPRNVQSATGETSDITILPDDSNKGRLWTQQSGGCGRPGDQIYLSYKALEAKDSLLGHNLVKEFAMYRYGVFEEQGYKNDPIHPMCFHDKADNVKITGCSDFPINDNGICDGSSTEYNVTKMVDSKARTSIMFAAEAPSVSMFCDEGNHDSYAPTKHNLICERRNTFDVILQNPDFHSYSPDSSGTIANTTTKITYKMYSTTRYVFVIENTKNMAIRESWTFLRSAIRKFVQFDLPENSEVGLVLTNDSDATTASGLKNLKFTDKNIIASALPYFTAETSQAPCLHCAISKALDMLKDISSPATNVIIVIAPGVNNNSHINDILTRARDEKVRIASINYPNIIRQKSLDFLAEETKGVAHTVSEQIQNVDNSMISTYFQLSNALYNIIEVSFAGNPNSIPLEIHRREIKNDRPSITGSFYLDENMGEPIKFMLYTHSQNPLIKNIVLISPTQQVYQQRIDTLDVKIVSILPGSSENGTWTYTIDPVAGNPQPHFLQVMAKPRNKTSKIIRSKFWIGRNQLQGPPILYVEVKKGNNPILSAKVEVRITKMQTNGSIWQKETIQLFDTGSGDPDITKGDGIYSRYHNAFNSGPGSYTYEVIVNDNGNTAYVYEEHIHGFMSKRAVTPFERALTPITKELSAEEINTANQQAAGRILDLKVELKSEEMKASLSWSAPDMGGHAVASYEVKYSENVEDIADYFEVRARNWDAGVPHILGIGSDTTFNLDLTRRKDLLDKPLYFAIKATSKISSVTTISNFVRVFIKSPPPPPTVPPTYSTYDHSWPINNSIDSARPNMISDDGFGNEIIFAVVGVVALLVIVLFLYYCFWVRKKTRASKSKSEALKSDKLNTTITIVPNTPVNQQSQQNCYSNQISDTDHTIGVPISYPYDDEPKKRYSLVHQQEQQLIEELKQQHMHQSAQNYSGLSVISNGTLQRNPTLSPYNSWSASQLLHEHERRHSPLTDEQMMTQHQEIMNQLDHMALNGQNVDHVSLSSHQMVNADHYGTSGHIPPPVPPLPNFNPMNFIYGVHQPQPNQVLYQSLQRNEPFNASLQGSMNSVNSGEKKRRNVTMV